MKTSASKSPVLVGLIAATAGFAGLAAVVSRAPQQAAGPLKPEFARPIAPPAQNREPRAERPTTAPADPTPTVSDAGVVRYVALQDGNPALAKEIALRPGEDARVRALAESVKSLGYPEIRVLKVTVDEGVATVDMSPGLLNEGFGSSAEAVFVEGLARTLGQFGDVKTFVLRVDGERVDSLGHLEISDPIDVIAPGAKPDESETPSREPTP